MSDEAKKELNEMSIEELYNLLNKADELKELALSKLESISEEELEVRSAKRGTKNWLSQ